MALNKISLELGTENLELSLQMPAADKRSGFRLKVSYSTNPITSTIRWPAP